MVVGFRSSTQPTEIVSRAQFDTQIETQRNYFDRISLILYFVDRPELILRWLYCSSPHYRLEIQ